VGGTGGPGAGPLVPHPGGTGRTGTRWHQAKSVQPRPLTRPSGRASVVIASGRSAAAVVGQDRYAITTDNEAVEASWSASWRWPGHGAPGPRPGRAHRRWPRPSRRRQGPRVGDVILMVPPLGGRDVSPWVAAKVRQLEQGRDAWAVTATERATVAAYPAEWVLGKQRLRAARPGTPFGHQRREP
jgi:hypothetical protein